MTYTEIILGLYTENKHILTHIKLRWEITFFRKTNRIIYNNIIYNNVYRQDLNHQLMTLWGYKINYMKLFYKINLLSLNISSPSLVQKTRSALIAPVTEHVSVTSSSRATVLTDKSTPGKCEDKQELHKSGGYGACRSDAVLKYCRTVPYNGVHSRAPHCAL